MGAPQRAADEKFWQSGSGSWVKSVDSGLPEPDWQATRFSSGRSSGHVPQHVIPRTVSIEMFNRHATGVRAHADGDGVKLAKLSFMPMRGI